MFQFNSPISLSLFTLVITAFLGSPVLAHEEYTDEERYPGLTQKFSLSIGGYTPRVDTEIKLGVLGGLVGTTIDLEDNLDFEDRPVMPAIELVWRWHPRHRLELGYFDLERSSTATLSESIDFGEVTFPPVEVSGFVDTDVLRLDYAYSFFNTGRSEFGILAGLHIIGFDVGLASTLPSLEESAGITAPLPNIGFQGTYAWNKRFAFTYKVHLFALEYDVYAGYFTNLFMSLEYAPLKALILGLGWNLYDFHIEVEDDPLVAAFDYTFSGPIVYARMGF